MNCHSFSDDYDAIRWYHDAEVKGPMNYAETHGIHRLQIHFTDLAQYMEQLTILMETAIHRRRTGLGIVEHD